MKIIGFFKTWKFIGLILSFVGIDICFRGVLRGVIVIDNEWRLFVGGVFIITGIYIFYISDNE